MQSKSDDQIQKELKAKSLKLLSTKARTEKEIKLSLLSITNRNTLVDQTIDWLKEKKLIDDKEYAKWAIESLSRTRPMGKKKINIILKRKGIALPQDLQIDELAQAQNALKTKLSYLSKLNIQDQKKKIISFLSYRGFSFATIDKILKTKYNKTSLDD